jgi:hypothetical protein
MDKIGRENHLTATAKRISFLISTIRSHVGILNAVGIFCFNFYLAKWVSWKLCYQKNP